MASISEDEDDAVTDQGGGDIMSEVNYRRNGMKYSTTGKCWGMAPKAGGFASDLPAKGPKPKSSRERRAAKKGKGR